MRYSHAHENEIIEYSCVCLIRLVVRVKQCVSFGESTNELCKRSCSCTSVQGCSVCVLLRESASVSVFVRECECVTWRSSDQEVCNSILHGILGIARSLGTKCKLVFDKYFRFTHKLLARKQ